MIKKEGCGHIFISFPCLCRFLFVYLQRLFRYRRETNHLETMTSNRLYSVGHSNQSQEEFLKLLRAHGVDCIVDVRSVPASKYSPQFNMQNLRPFLLANGIQYLPFGEEFGARRTDSIGADGQVDFELAVGTQGFRQGVERIMKGLQRGFSIAFMCSEANPLECHRFSLVSRYFYDHGLDVQHILKDGSLASHAVLEEVMIRDYLHSRKHHLPEVDELFGEYTREDQRRDAYRLKNKEIGFRPQFAFEDSY